jgi:hypothetical protein
MIISRIPEFNSVFIGYFIIVIAAGRIVIREENRRAWILSAFATTMLSALGSVELLAWILAETSFAAMTPSPMTNTLIEFLKAYLAVDLIYCAFWHPHELHLLDGWIHHILYILAADKLQQDYQVGCTRPFWVVEIPAAIRAWQALGVITQATADRWFGATFLAFRIMWPMYAITQLVTQTWVFCFVGLIIVAHIIWFSNSIGVDWTRLYLRG